MIDETLIECDEAGFVLHLTGDLNEELERYLNDPEAHTVRFRLSQDAAIQLHAQARVEIGPWLQEMEFHRDAYARATDEERAVVLGFPVPEDSYVDAALAAGDLARKRSKGE